MNCPARFALYRPRTALVYLIAIVFTGAALAAISVVTATPAEADVTIGSNGGGQLKVGGGCVAITGHGNDLFVGDGCEGETESPGQASTPSENPDPETAPMPETSSTNSGGTTTSPSESTLPSSTESTLGGTEEAPAGTTGSTAPAQEAQSQPSVGGTEITPEEYEILQGLLERCQTEGSAEPVEEEPAATDPAAEQAAEQALAEEGLSGEALTETQSLTPEQCELLAAALEQAEPEPQNVSNQEPVGTPSGNETGCPAKAPDTSLAATVEEVVDGDTIELSEEVEGKTTVRLIGVDTPETVDPETEPEPYGAEASDFTTEQLEGQEVLLEIGEGPEDDYGRLLAYVYTNEGMFNETLLREGYGELLIIDPNNAYEECLAAAEEQARDEGLGIWSESLPSTIEQTVPEETTGGTTGSEEPAEEPGFSIFNFGKTEPQSSGQEAPGATTTEAAGGTTTLPQESTSSPASALPEEPAEAEPAAEPLQEDVPPVETLSGVIPVEEPVEPQPELEAALPVEETPEGETVDYLPTTGGPEPLSAGSISFLPILTVLGTVLAYRRATRPRRG